MVCLFEYNQRTVICLCRINRSGRNAVDGNRRLYAIQHKPLRTGDDQGIDRTSSVVMQCELRGSQKVTLGILTMLLFSAALGLMLGANMAKSLDHDEHQFVTSGALLARETKLPYVDYAYFHMPNMVFVYAVLFSVTDHLLLSARLFSTVCAWLTLGLIFCLALCLFRHYHYLLRFLIAASTTVFLLTNPVFAYTSGKAWNHDLAILMALGAFVMHSEGASREHRQRWLGVSGLLLGLAIGTRLTFAPLVLPFLVMIAFYPRRAGWRGTLSLMLSFLLGTLVGLLPSAILFALAPKQFLFGNFGYARYNTLYRQVEGFVEGDVSSIAMSFSGKLCYLARYILSTPSMVLLILAFVFFVLSMNIARFRRVFPHRFPIIFSLISLPFLLLGSFSPTPAFFQYFYAPIPFLLVGTLYGVASFQDQNNRMNWSTTLLVHVLLLAGAFGLKLYQDAGSLSAPDEWLSSRVHQAGLEIKATAGDRPVLSLAPLLPLEGGASILAEFATGPFGWRIAPFVPEKTRQEIGLIAEADLVGFLQAHPHAAILVGHEGTLEQPFIEYAEDYGYQPVELSDGSVLWLAPQ